VSADLEAVLLVNVGGTIWTVQAALPYLRRHGGRVICVGSVAGRNGVLQGRGYTADAVPLKRFGRAEEIASVAVFLASPGADYITGTIIDANGGSFIG
jgi:3-oxoacyl-[acyl-carrier protein] reductase